MKKLTELNPRQQAALLELLVLGMYSDAHLALAEDERLHRFLEECGVTDKSAQRGLINDAVSSTRRTADSQEHRRTVLLTLTKQLNDEGLAPLAAARLEDLLIADGKFGDREEAYLAEIKGYLRC